MAGKNIDDCQPVTAFRGESMENSRSDTAITFDPETHTYRLPYDKRSDESVSTAVVRGVAAVTNTPTTELDPLFEVIDPDALECLFSTARGRSLRDHGWVSFEYNGCEVNVSATNEVEITPAEDNPITSPVPRTVRDR